MAKVLELREDGLKKNPLEGYMVYLSRGETMRLIESLAKQINTQNPNCGRAEYTCEQGYLSFVVGEYDERD